MKSRCATDSVAYFFSVYCAGFRRCMDDACCCLMSGICCMRILRKPARLLRFFIFGADPVLLQGRCLRRCGRNPGGYSGDFSFSARIVSVALLVVDGAVVLRIFVRRVRNPVVERDFRLQQLLVDQIFVALAACESVVLRGDDGAVVWKLYDVHVFAVLVFRVSSQERYRCCGAVRKKSGVSRRFGYLPERSAAAAGK